MQNHVDIVFFGETHDLVERFPAVVATVKVPFIVTHVAVCSNEDADCVRTWHGNQLLMIF